MSTIAFLFDLRFAVIPLLPKSKMPANQGWQHVQVGECAPSDFGSDANVGVNLGRPSGNLVDIDIDNPVAAQIADLLLPPTGLEFSRASSARAHRLYRTDGEPGRTVRFTSQQEPSLLGGPKSTIIEYRADGSQTMVPPSTHPDGELVRFDKIGEPALVTREELLLACGRIAAVVELAPHYKPGLRQDFIMALAGAFMASGMTQDGVAGIVRALCSATGDEDVEQRLDAVSRTSGRIQSSQPFQQRAHLIALLGPSGKAIVAKLEQHLGLTAPKPSPAKRELAQADLPEEVNDTALAKAYSAFAKGQAIYVEEHARYYVYNDSGLWEPDPKRLRIAMHFDSFLEEHALRAHASDRKQYKKYHNRTPAMAVLDQAQSYLRVPLSTLDANELLLGVNNGAIDLATGQLRPPSPDHYLTRALDVDFDPSATCPLFDQFLLETFGGDSDMVDYMLGIGGYCVTPRTDRQEFYILHGSGNNGKSVLVNVLAAVLGEFAKPIMPETLFEAGSGQAANDLASVAQCRLIYAGECESQSRLHSALIKRFTGQDNFKVKRLYRDVEEISPKFKVFMICNRLPNSDMCDGALKRRIKCIEFAHVVPKDRIDKKLTDKLLQEKSGILNRLVQGAKRYLSDEIVEPVSVSGATRSYFEGQNSIDQFLLEYTSAAQGSHVLKGELFAMYERFCSEEHLLPVSKKDFGRCLVSKGYVDGKVAAGRVWRDLSLQSNVSRAA